MPRLFGFEFDFNRRSSAPIAVNTTPTSNTVSFVPPDNQDGALNVQFGAAGGHFGYYLDLDGGIPEWRVTGQSVADALDTIRAEVSR